MQAAEDASLALTREIASAESTQALAALWRRLPVLVQRKLIEGTAATAVVPLISSALRDITGRAAALAERAMVDAGWGPSPAPWAVLVLGSGGRGESALSADQDNAIVHGGNAGNDMWFAEAGRRICESLAFCGIPLCKGGVMAVNAPWRKPLGDWFAAIDQWIRDADGDNLLNMDIFLDFRPAFGEAELADALRAHLLTKAAKHAPFLHALATSLHDIPVPLNMFGDLSTSDGPFSIKRSALLPLVSTVRLLAVKHHVAATSTRQRVEDLAGAGFLSEGDAVHLLDVHALVTELLLYQQLRDLARGRELSSNIDPAELDAGERKRLQSGLRHIRNLKQLVETALPSV